MDEKSIGKKEKDIPEKEERIKRKRRVKGGYAERER